MIDVGTSLVRFAQLCREMGGSTDVQFGSPTNNQVGGRYLSNCEQGGLKAGDVLDVYAQASGNTQEWHALKAMQPGLEAGVKVRVTYSPEAVVMLALSGCVPNDFGTLVEDMPGVAGDLKAIAKQVQSSLPRPT